MTPGHDPGEAVVLAFLLAGVLPGGGSAPRMFYRSIGEGYADARCATGRVVSAGPDAGVGISFELPHAPFDFLLLEPAALTGRYRVLRLAFAGEALPDLARRTMTAVEQLDPDNCTAGLVFASEDSRPALELDVRGLVRHGPGDRLEMVLRRESQGPTLGPRTPAGLATGGAEGASAAVGRLAREVASLSNRVAELASLQATAAARHEATSATLSSVVAGQERALTELAGQAEATRACIESAAAAASSRQATADAAAAGGRDATLQAIAALHARVDVLANAVENVFWRRWLRRLRGGGR